MPKGDRYIPMNFYEDYAQARKTLREDSLLALERQIELSTFHRGSKSLPALYEFLQVYEGRFIEDDFTRQALATSLQQRIVGTVETAPTYYVSHDMVVMTAMAAQEMPNEGLSPADLPSGSGFLYFATPYKIRGVGVDEIYIRALAWTQTQVGIPSDRHDKVSGLRPIDYDTSVPGIEYYLFTDPEEVIRAETQALVKKLRADGREVPEPVMIQGITGKDVKDIQGPLPIYDFSGWAYGKSWQVVLNDTDLSEDGYGQVHPVVDSARRMLLSLWKLLQEEITVLATERAPRHMRRRAGRHMPHTGDVVVIKLRREFAPSVPGAETDDQGSDEPWYTHRFLVRGHWRRQPYGPGKAQQKLRWIGPYIKGPKDAPLVVKQKIFSLEG